MRNLDGQQMLDPDGDRDTRMHCHATPCVQQDEECRPIERPRSSSTEQKKRTLTRQTTALRAQRAWAGNREIAPPAIKIFSRISPELFQTVTLCLIQYSQFFSYIFALLLNTSLILWRMLGNGYPHYTTIIGFVSI